MASKKKRSIYAARGKIDDNIRFHLTRDKKQQIATKTERQKLSQQQCRVAKPV